MKKKTKFKEPITVTRLIQIVINNHLVLFEIACKFDFTREDMIVHGDIKQTVFEIEEKEE